MVATNAVRPRSGNVSAGTSVFAMIVLEQPLSKVHHDIDIVATPDGKPVAMAHANNGSSDLDAWLSVFGQVAEALGVPTGPNDLYEKLLPLALQAEPDAGGLLSINYVSGEHVTGFSEGRPLFARAQDSNFTLANLMRAMYFSSLCAVRAGMNILTRSEGVAIDEIRGHGGFFKVGHTGQRMMAAALGVPVSVPSTAGEGGAWGMALLAAYALEGTSRQTLAEFLDSRIAASIGEAVPPDAGDVQGFAAFFERHARGLAIERAAIEALR
jgi:sugar (pentulose or hexulose) kinase